MTEVTNPIFTHNAQNPAQRAVIGAFERIAGDNPDIVRYALGVGDVALSSVDTETLSTVQDVIGIMFGTRADLAIQPHRGQDLEQDTAYSTSLMDWRIASWASKVNDELRESLNHRRRTIRLGLIVDAALSAPAEAKKAGAIRMAA